MSPPNRPISRNRWAAQKYCNEVCASEAQRGVPKTEAHRRKLSEAHSGKVLSAEHRRKIGESGRKTFSQLTPEERRARCGRDQHGALNHNWKEDPGYAALHYRVGKLFDRPSACESCGKPDGTSANGSRHHWASLDHRYTMQREDWLYLCGRCHVQHDAALRKLSDQW